MTEEAKTVRRTFTLKELEFTNPYFAEDRSAAFLRGMGGSKAPTSVIPDGIVTDLDTLQQAVFNIGQRKAEFPYDFDNVRYRVAKINNEGGVWYTLRRHLSPIPELKTIRGIEPLAFKTLGALGKRGGLILFAGKTGQGKTTTASSLLKAYLSVYGDVAVTIEDPPELRLEGPHGKFGRCFQIAVENGDFGSALSKTMRYTPRYILLGEIRRKEEASEALRAAINGHLIIATIHAGSIKQAIDSLIKLASVQDGQDIAQSTLADGLLAVAYQTMSVEKDLGRMINLETLFLSGDEQQDAPIRTLIRQGKTEMLSSVIESQKTLMSRGQPPIRLIR